jgi:DNA segregation ATPase FtsK/SpoIIIE-like protein
MAKKSSSKKVTAKKLERKPKKEASVIQLQIWGVVYVSLGLLLFTSILSHRLTPEQNILGPWIGRYLSLGLEFFFGPVAIFLIPPMIMYIGVRIFRGESCNAKSLVSTAMILVEASLLAAVPSLPYILHPEFQAPGNAFGHIVVRYVFSPIFGTATFGPYFILTVALALTIVGFLQIDLHELFRRIKAAWIKSREVAKERAEERALEKAERREERERVREERKTVKQEAIKEKKARKKGEPSIEELAKQMEEDDDSSEEEEPIAPVNIVDSPIMEPNETTTHLTPPALSQEELSSSDEGEFTPPTITTYSDEMPEEPEYVTEDMDGNIGDAAFLEPSLASGDIDAEDHLSTASGELVEDIPKQKPYQLPTPDLIPDPPAKNSDIDRIWIEEKSIKLTKTLEEFKLKGCKVVNAYPGPVVTQFEIELAPGIQVKKVVNLQDDIALKVGGKSIRIQAPIPGKAAVGIEIPNDDREIVFYKEILTSPAFQNSKAKLPVIVGKSISGKPLVEDISKMPHLLIAGQTGAGKSVGINSFIASLLFSKTPEELRMIMIDPKKVEMACYEGIPHLMSPVVTEPEKAVAALQWGVKEMEYRYRLLANVGAKNLESFNNKAEAGTLDKFVTNGKIEPEENRKLPFVVIIIDELADLMMTASKDVEALVQRIAQLARAVGIHLIVATQRPSVDIITGPIKANLTSRISFRTIQSQDSRTILGSVGAEKLLGMGDMLYLKNGAPTIERYHGAFISEEDVDNLVEQIRDQGYETGKIEFKAAPTDEGGEKSIPQGDGEKDELFEEVARLVLSNGIASTSMVQRRFKIGYNRAGRIMDQLEDCGVVGPSQGGKPREILIANEMLDEILETVL